MKRVSMVEFRRHAASIIHKARNGRTLILTYRGKPVLRLEPIRGDVEVREDDPFYSLGRIAEARGKKLKNRQIDSIVYGK